MKVKIEVDLKPFGIPNFVIVKQEPGLKQDGLQESKQYKISELDSGTLLKMCEEFKISVFEKAGKKVPLIMSDT